MSDPSRTIVTLKWGDRYPAEYVNRLYNSVGRHLDGEFRFVCFTDDGAGLNEAVEVFPIPDIDVPHPQILTGWRKLCLFRDDLPLDGECLFLDLDVVITGPLDRFFTYEIGKIPIIHNWVHWRKELLGKRPNVGNSSVFRWTANEHGHVVEQYVSEKEWALKNFQPPQTYLTHCIREHMVFWPEGWTKSFKRHCRPVFPLNKLLEPRLPAGASIIVFHGVPDPHEATRGYTGKRIHHSVKPAEWIAEHWR